MKKIVHTEKAPAPIGPYSQAVEAGGFMFISGQIPMNPETGAIVSSGIPDETRQVMENIGAILTAAGLSFADVIKTSIFLTDMANFGAVNEVYGNYFSAEFPARETVAVAGLPRNVRVEISVTAIKR